MELHPNEVLITKENFDILTDIASNIGKAYTSALKEQVKRQKFWERMNAAIEDPTKKDIQWAKKVAKNVKL